jgi:hypothetical protein
MGKLYPVEQRHWDAAADLIRVYWLGDGHPQMRQLADSIQNGGCKCDVFSQAFARFEAEHLTRIEATPAVDREALISLIRSEMMSTDHPVSDWETAFADKILALPPVKQSLTTEVAERVREACAAACREALFPKNEQSDWTDFAAVCAGNAVTAEHAIRSLDITGLVKP